SPTRAPSFLRGGPESRVAYEASWQPHSWLHRGWSAAPRARWVNTDRGRTLFRLLPRRKTHLPPRTAAAVRGDGYHLEPARGYTENSSPAPASGGTGGERTKRGRTSSTDRRRRLASPTSLPPHVPSRPSRRRSSTFR